MYIDYDWYECLYPGIPENYFVNIHTGIAERTVPDQEEKVRLLKQSCPELDTDGTFCFYISFLRSPIRVKEQYIKESTKEIDLQKDEVVFVMTRSARGWVYVETLENGGGYVPLSFLQPILVETNNSNSMEDSREKNKENKDKSARLSVRPRSSHSVTRHTFNANQRMSVTARRKTMNRSFSIGIQNSQTESTSIQLMSTMFPMYIRRIFSTRPITPYDIWLAESAKRVLNISQSAFQKILLDCEIDLSLYNELITDMEATKIADDFVLFDGDVSRATILSSSRNLRRSVALSSGSISPVEEQIEKLEELEKAEEEVETKLEEPASDADAEILCTDPIIPIYSDIEYYDFRQYASIYFQREKPRIFHSFSLDDLISFNHRVPLLPLHPISLKDKDVLDVERKILMLMHVTSYDDDEENESVESREGRLMQEIVYSSVCSQDFFDEIVCYLIKQTNNNPDEDSQIQGYRLLFLLLSLRRPSYHLFEYVLNYVYQQLTSSGRIGSLTWAIMQLMLDDTYQPEEQCYNSDRYAEAKRNLSLIGDKGLAMELFQNTSLEDVIQTENAALLLLRHGILPPNNAFYAWDCSIPECTSSECNLRQFLNPMLQGIIVYLRTPESNDFKERMLVLDRSLLKVTWVSIKSGKHHVYELQLKDVTEIREEDLDGEWFGIQFVDGKSEAILELAVNCKHERDRILHFFTNLLKWYKEKDKDIATILEKTGYTEDPQEEEAHNWNLFYRDIRRSLESYFSTVQLMSFGARYYSTMNGYDFMAMGISAKLIGITTPTSSLHSNQGSLSSEKKSFGSLRAAELTNTSQSADTTAMAQKSPNMFANQDPVIINDLMEYSYHPEIPRLIQILCKQLINLEGYRERGIFRISPGKDEATQLRSELSVGYYEAVLSVGSVHVIAGIIKEFLRSLTPRLVPSSLWDDIVRIGKTGHSQLDEAWKLINTLPRSNFMTLMYLLTIAYKFSFVESNEMKIPAFMIVLAPNLINRERREGEDEYTADMLYAGGCKYVNDFFSLITSSLPNYFDMSIFDDDFAIE